MITQENIRPNSDEVNRALTRLTEESYQAEQNVPRKKELKYIKDKIQKPSNEHSQVLFIQGVGGVGKTWLARSISKTCSGIEDSNLVWSYTHLSPTNSSIEHMLSIRNNIQFHRKNLSLKLNTIQFKKFEFSVAQYWRKHNSWMKSELTSVANHKENSDIAANVLDAAGTVVNIIADSAIASIGPFKGAGLALLDKLSEKSMFKDPKMSNILELDELQFRVAIPSFLAEDINSFTQKKNKSVDGEIARESKVVIIIDNYDCLLGKTNRGYEERAERWIFELASKTKGAIFILLGRETPSWISKNYTFNQACEEGAFKGEYTKLPLDNMESKEAKKMVERIEVIPTDLADKIIENNLLPIVIKSKCEWVLKEWLKKEEFPSLNQVPTTLPIVYERLLQYRDKNEQLLMTAMAIAGKFNKRLMSGLSNNLNLSLTSTNSFDSIIASASVINLDTEWMCFHDTLKEHLLENHVLALGDNETESVELNRAVFFSIFDLLDQEVGILNKQKLIVWSFSTILADFFSFENSQDQCVKNLDEAIRKSTDIFSQLTQKEYLVEAKELGLIIHAFYLKYQKNSKHGSYENSLLASVLRLIRVLCPLLCSRWSGSDVSLSVEIIISMEKHLSSYKEDNTLSNLGASWVIEAACLDLTKVSVRRGIPYDYKLDMTSLFKREDFTQELSRTLDHLVSSLEHCQINESFYKEASLIAAISASKLAHELGKLKVTDAASERFIQARALFENAKPFENIYTHALALVRHYLYRPSENIPELDLKQSADQLEQLNKVWPNNIEVLELYSRTMIRVAFKRQAGELPINTTIHSSIDKALDLIISSIKGSNIKSLDFRVIRLILRLERKRRELEALEYDKQEALDEIIESSIENLGISSSTIFLTIIKELGSRIKSDVRKYSELFLNLYYQCQNTFSINRKSQTINLLYVIARDLPLAEIERLNLPLVLLREDILSQKLVNSGNNRVDAASTAINDLYNNVKLKLLSGNILESMDVKTDLSQIRSFYRSVSPEAALTQAEREFMLIDELRNNNLEASACRLLNECLTSLKSFGTKNLKPYLDALEYKFKYFSSLMSKEEYQRDKKRFGQVNSTLRKNNVIGSMLYSIRGLQNNKTKQDLRSRLVYEVFAIAENTLNQKDKLRLEVRQLFASTIIDALYLHNSNSVEYRGGSKLSLESKPSRECINEFVNGDKSRGLYFELLDLLSKYKVESTLPGVKVVGNFYGKYKVDDDAGVSFECQNKYVYISNDLLNRNIYKSMNPNSSEETVDDDQVADTSNSEVENKPYILCINGEDRGKVTGTMVGEKYVEQCLPIFLPGINRTSAGKKKTWVTLGASRTWAVVRVKPEMMNTVLAGGGNLHRFITEFMSLRRLTFIPISHPNDPEPVLTEMRHFVNNSMGSLIILKLSISCLSVTLPENIKTNPANMRAWRSMFKKLYPETFLDIQGIADGEYGSDEEDDNNDFWSDF